MAFRLKTRLELPPWEVYLFGSLFDQWSGAAVKSFPPKYFYHIAEPANLESIQRHGLLSTERLMRQVLKRDEELHSALGQHRPDTLVLSNGVIIRDQSPMPPRSLKPALSPGMEPSDWYRFLNGFVFLWANQGRVDRHLMAFRKRPQVLLVFDAVRLTEEKGDQLFLSPINSGNAMRRAAPRSYDLFVLYHVWRDKGWLPINGQSRSKATAPAEIAIKGHLPLKPYLIETRSV